MQRWHILSRFCRPSPFCIQTLQQYVRRKFVYCLWGKNRGQKKSGKNSRLLVERGLWSFLIIRQVLFTLAITHQYMLCMQAWAQKSVFPREAFAKPIFIVYIYLKRLLFFSWEPPPWGIKRLSCPVVSLVQIPQRSTGIPVGWDDTFRFILCS